MIADSSVVEAAMINALTSPPLSTGSAKTIPTWCNVNASSVPLNAPLTVSQMG